MTPTVHVYTHVKKNTTICKKIVHRNLIRQRAAILWFASGFVRQARNTVLRRIFAKRATFSREKQDCGTLQDEALSGIASKCGAHGGINTAHGTPR